MGQKKESHKAEFVRIWEVAHKSKSRWAGEGVLPTGGLWEALGGVITEDEHKYVVKKEALSQILMVEKDMR